MLEFRLVKIRSDRKSTRLNSSHTIISYAVFWLKKKIRSEEHTSELQSHDNIVCRVLLEKKISWRATFPATPRLSTSSKPPRSARARRTRGATHGGGTPLGVRGRSPHRPAFFF